MRGFRPASLPRPSKRMTSYSFDSNSRLVLEPKDKIRERVGFSPDVGDALALTFAETIRCRDAGRRPRPYRANSSYNPLRWRARA